MSLTQLKLHSEPYAATGNIGENIRRLLGVPSLDAFQTLLREAVQNSCDAAVGGDGPEILIRVRKLESSESQTIRDRVLSELPEEPDSHERLERFRGCDRPIVLEICDFRTKGLGGPTRADLMPEGTDTTDFVDFIRNVGIPRSSSLRGGSYGFGKMSFYRSSRCSTVLVDTLAAPSFGGERRMIGCHIGRSFGRTSDGVISRFTGRHWWGVPQDGKSGFVEPLTGDGAESLARLLGFPERDGGRHGTSVMVLDFDPGDDGDEEISGRLVEALLWHFWPRLMRDCPEDRRIHFVAEVFGERLSIPDPEDFPPLDLFCAAMRDARKRDPTHVEEVRSARPAKCVGHLKVKRGLRGKREPLRASEGSLIPHTSRHIAAMRSVELVVRYFEGSALPDDRVESAGVFLASDDPEIDRAFVNSEPPAHDDWISSNLETKREKVFVNRALRRIGEVGRDIAQPPASPPPSDGADARLAAVAGVLGTALDGYRREGGAPLPRGGAPGRKPVRKARASQPEYLGLKSVDGEPIASFRTQVVQDAGRTGVTLEAYPAVVLDGGATESAEAITATAPPRVIRMLCPDGGHAVEGGTLALNGADGEFLIDVSVPPDAAVTVRVVVKEGERQ